MVHSDGVFHFWILPTFTLLRQHDPFCQERLGICVAHSLVDLSFPMDPPGGCMVTALIRVLLLWLLMKSWDRWQWGSIWSEPISEDAARLERLTCPGLANLIQQSYIRKAESRLCFDWNRMRKHLSSSLRIIHGFAMTCWLDHRIESVCTYK